MSRGVVAGFVLSLIGLSACDDGAYVRHGDVTFTDAERIEIERGNAWIAAHVGAEPEPIVWDLPHPADDDETVANAIVRRPHGAHGGFENDRTWTVYIGVDETGTAYGAALYAHERGHRYGLGHTTSDEPSVMRSHDPVLTWTPLDKKACVDVGRCEP